MSGLLIKDTLIMTSGTGEILTGSVAVEKNIIKYAGEVPESFKADSVIDGRGFLAVPGLVNAHVHSPMGLLRNLADDLPFNDWLFGRVIPAENKLNEDDIYWGSLLGMAEMIRSGVTCFADMYIHMPAVAKAAAESGMRSLLSFGPITSEFRGGKTKVDSKSFYDFTAKWNGAENGRIKTCMEIHSVYLYEKHLIGEAAALAKETGSLIHIHLSESAAEMTAVKEKYGVTPIQAALDFGVFEVPTLAAHCVYATAKDIALMKKHGVSAVHCLSSNLKLANGFAPAARMLKSGVNVCLGTDGSASNNNLNLIEEMHITALIHKGLGRDPKCLPAGDVIDMATVNGARALGFEDTGIIASGNKADIALISLNAPHLCPLNNPRAALVYAAQAADVDTVIADGKILMRGRELLCMDERLVMAKARETAAKIAG